MTVDRERTRFYSTRPRRIPPEFCNDELLEECSQLAALLLYRIISQADDQGRLPGHPKYIRGVCVPMRSELTERKVGAAITELVRAGFLVRYEAQGRTFLQVERWQDLQGKWGRRAYASRYPAPPGWTHDWVSVKSAEDELEVRAPGTQTARDLLPPITSPFSSSSALPSAGLGTPGPGSRPMERVGDLLGRANDRELTKDEALELGEWVAGHEQTAPVAGR